MQQANTGWLFYRDYYRGINFRAKDNDPDNEKRFGAKNKAIFHKLFDPATVESFVRTEQSLKFETCYPGLLIGSGYNHETGLLGEIKIGFHFDHTTGMPYLPGSSVKGVIRSAFDHQNYLLHIAREELEIGRDDGWRKELLSEIFTGENRSNMYQHDTFHDAIITRGNLSGHFLGPDFITPHHHNPLHNPIPIQFLKILPGVEITFYFELHDGVISGKDKLKLFRRILKDTGIGAKTNVGYGWLK